MSAVAVAVHPEARWRQAHTIALLVVLGALAAGGFLVPSLTELVAAPNHLRIAAWVGAAVLLVAFVAVLSHGLTGYARGALVDRRNRVSLARVQVGAWTILVLSALYAAALVNVGADEVSPLSMTIPNELWLAMGVSTASMVASPFVIKTTKRRKEIATHGNIASSSWLDLFLGEEADNSDWVDLSRVQLFFFTFVLVLLYGTALASTFWKRHPVVHSLPAMNDALVVLLTVSHAGYLTKKAVPKPRG
jgi:hypothetical protein